MKFSAAAVIAAAVSGAAAWGNVTVTTEVVTAYTTYCPYATQITHGSTTYTVTEPTTLTITDCPCTITRPVTISSYVSCQTSCSPVYNTTIATQTPTGGMTPTTSAGSVTVPTGGAGKAAALSGAGLAGIVGLAAFVL